MACEWTDKIFAADKDSFEALALEIFRFQYQENKVYHSYVNALNVKPLEVGSITDIPFLPISFFKTHTVISGDFDPGLIFESSGTTNTGNSRHFLKDPKVYITSFTNCFESFYGNADKLRIIGLLPSYLERSNSSLVYMVDHLIKKGNNPESGFYLEEFDKLERLLKLSCDKQTILIGVTFALLDFAEKNSLPLKNTVVMETGGMKGRREEMTRAEVHSILTNAFGVEKIHSEYGMTELLSQAYSKGNGLFQTPPWMKILLRDEEDPLLIKNGVGMSGVINIIDLANVYSCSFIATDDVGRINNEGNFEVLGRMDYSDLRGCSLMVV